MHVNPRLTLHCASHPPQLKGWICVSVQNPPQSIRPGSQTSGAAVVVVDVVVGAAVVVVVVVVGAEVVVVVATVPEQFPGGMQRELPLDQTQQTQPGLQTPGFAPQTALPHCAWV